MAFSLFFVIKNEFCECECVRQGQIFVDNEVFVVIFLNFMEIQEKLTKVAKITFTLPRENRGSSVPSTKASKQKDFRTNLNNFTKQKSFYDNNRSIPAASNSAQQKSSAY